MKSTYTLVYMGTPPYADTILASLIEADDMRVGLVVTQPDRPVGRRKTLTPPPVKIRALEHDIPVIQPDNLRDPQTVEAIAAVQPDFIVVAAFGQLLPRSVLDLAPCINLHASLLPQYRGASPIQQALLNGDTLTGVTAMRMEEGLDTGPMLAKVTYAIPPDMRLQALTAQLARDAAALTLRTLRDFATLSPVPQPADEATYCTKIRRADGRVDLRDARTLYDKYRAFEGWPGIFAEDGTKLDEVTLISAEGAHRAGEILAFEDGALVVGCAQGSVRIGTLQPPSKKPMSAQAYCVGRGLRVGDTLF